jgi:hypothetical protein
MDKETIAKVMRELARRGGEARAKKHSKSDLSKWGKMGGRPKKAKKKGN